MQDASGLQMGFNAAVLGLTLMSMAATEPTLKWVANKMGRDTDKLINRIEWACKPEIQAMVGFLIMLMGNFAIGTDIHDIEHVFSVLDWHAAVLVGAMMFQSLQLGRYIKIMMAGLQRLAKSDERIFNAAALLLFGAVSALLSEVAVAAGISAGVAMVNQYQKTKAKERLLVYLAAAVGIGGGLSSFAAPSIVIAANKFGWSNAETLLYLGPMVFLSLIILAGVSFVGSENCRDSVKIQTEPLRRMDWVNLTMWAAILYFGVFAEPKSITGMLVVLAISTVANGFYAYSGKENVTGADELVEDALDAPHSHDARTHYWEQLLETGLVFGFLVALMFMGDSNAPLFAIFGEMLPGDPVYRSYALFGSTSGFSAGADNALAVVQLGPLTEGNLLQQIAVAWGSLVGGTLTIIGNAPNLVVLVLFAKSGVKVSFGRWIIIAAPITFGIAALSVGYLWILDYWGLVL